MTGIGLHIGSKDVLGAIVTGCIDGCQEKMEGRFWDEAGAGYPPSGSKEVKVWRRWSRFLLVDCCSWVLFLGSASVELCWGGLTGKAKLGV